MFAGHIFGRDFVSEKWCNLVGILIHVMFIWSICFPYTVRKSASSKYKPCKNICFPFYLYWMVTYDPLFETVVSVVMTTDLFVLSRVLGDRMVCQGCKASREIWYAVIYAQRRWNLSFSYYNWLTLREF